MTMARYSGVVQDQAGNIITNAKVEVRKELPGAALAALKLDRAGATPLLNPFDAEADGTFFFHVVGGAYQVRVYTGPSGAPTFEEIRRYVPVGMAAETDGLEISDIDLTMFAPDVADTDDTLAADSDDRIPTQKAVKTYVDDAVGSSGSFPDAARRNLLLTTAYQSKSFAEYRRLVLMFATGFKGASDALNGINTGSSSNYTVDSSGGKVSPAVSGSDTLAAQTMNADNAAFSGYGVRQLIPASALTTNGTSVQITITGPSTGNPTVLADVFIGAANTAPNFSSPTRITFNGGSSGVTVPVGGSVTSDVITYTLNEAVDQIISMGVTSGDFRDKTSATGFTRYYKAADAASAGTASVSGYSNIANDLFGVSRIQVNVGISNMTLVTASQTADSSVSNGQVLLEIGNAASPTLNTDLTVEVTCNGGSNWSTATLSSVTSYSQGGRKVVETSDTACTSGTSFAARIKTLNNKNVPIHAATVTVH